MKAHKRACFCAFIPFSAHFPPNDGYGSRLNYAPCGLTDSMCGKPIQTCGGNMTSYMHIHTSLCNGSGYTSGWLCCTSLTQSPRLKCFSYSRRNDLSDSMVVTADRIPSSLSEMSASPLGPSSEERECRREFTSQAKSCFACRNLNFTWPALEREGEGEREREGEGEREREREGERERERENRTYYRHICECNVIEMKLAIYLFNYTHGTEEHGIHDMQYFTKLHLKQELNHSSQKYPQIQASLPAFRHLQYENVTSCKKLGRLGMLLLFSLVIIKLLTS